MASLPLGGGHRVERPGRHHALTGELIALNRSTGAIVYQQKLPAETNSPIAIAGNTVLVPAGAP